MVIAVIGRFYRLELFLPVYIEFPCVVSASIFTVIENITGFVSRTGAERLCNIFAVAVNAFSICGNY